MAQDGYKPNGWLGLQLGKAVWVPCWSVELAQSSLPTMLDRTKPGLGAKMKPVTASSSSAATTGTSSSSSVTNAEVLELLKVMQQQMATLTLAVEEMKSDVKKVLQKNS